MIEFAPIEVGLLTPGEAAVYLRLSSGEAGMSRLVTRGAVRPCCVGGRRCYAKHELDRFIRDETEGRVHPARPKQRTARNGAAP